MTATKMETVTVEQIEEKFAEFFNLVTRYVVDQEINPSDQDYIGRLKKRVYATGDTLRGCYDTMNTLNVLAHEHRRNLIVCNNARGLAPYNFDGLSILHILNENSEVSRSIILKTVAKLKEARVYSFDPNTDELTDVTDKYREV